MKWLENRKLFKKYKKALKKMKCSDFKVSPPKGIFERGFGDIGRMLDDLYYPFLEYSHIILDWYSPIIQEIIDLIPSIVSHEEFQIRYWLYQKQKYFGWK